MTLQHPEAQRLIGNCEFQLRKMLADKTITIFAFSNIATRPQREVVEVILKLSGLSFHQLTERSRKREVVRVRQLMVYCLKRLSKMTCVAIADFLNYDNHTTVLHCEREVVNRLLEGDTETCSMLVKIYATFEEKDKKAAA